MVFVGANGVLRDAGISDKDAATAGPERARDWAMAGGSPKQPIDPVAYAWRACNPGLPFPRILRRAPGPLVDGAYAKPSTDRWESRGNRRNGK